MKILVSGGAGFIGSHLTHCLLDEGHEVIVLDDLSSGQRRNLAKGVQLIKMDIAHPRLRKKLPKTIDIIYHLAAQIDVRKSVHDPVKDAAINVLGTVQLLEYAKEAAAKQLIFSSSGGAIYGEAAVYPTPETAPEQPLSPYGTAKLSAEQYVHLYARLYGLHTTVLRYANVYGPGQAGSKESGVIAIFSERARKNLPLTVHGDGRQTRDFVYVKDVVLANLAALRQQVSGIFNIGTGVETSINELIDLLKSLSESELNIRYEQAKQGDLPRSVLDCSRAADRLNWKAKTSLPEGLRLTFAALNAE